MARGSKAIRRGQSVEFPKTAQSAHVCVLLPHTKPSPRIRMLSISTSLLSPHLVILPTRDLTEPSPLCTSKLLTRLLPDPACGTCRKKCRKCDRSRPICNRCKAKGLHCEGYPPRFQFCELATPDAESAVNAAPAPAPAPAQAPAVLPVSSPGPIPSGQISAIVSPSEPRGLTLDSQPSIGAAPRQSSPPPPLWETDFSPLAQDVHGEEASPPASGARLLDDLLLSCDTQELLRYCKSVVFRIIHLDKLTLLYSLYSNHFAWRLSHFSFWLTKVARTPSR
jgi:hypothetical protein